MKEDLGELIVSTRSAAVARKAYIYIVSGLLFVLGIFWFTTVEPSALRQSFGRDMSTIIYWAAGMGIMCFAVFLVIASLRGFRSYCDVYENGVVGTTGMSASKNASPQQNFRLGYDEIVNATESGKTVFIYTKYATLEVLALKNRVEVCQAIRMRAKGTK